MGVVGFIGSQAKRWKTFKFLYTVFSFLFNFREVPHQLFETELYSKLAEVSI